MDSGSDFIGCFVLLVIGALVVSFVPEIWNFFVWIYNWNWLGIFTIIGIFIGLYIMYRFQQAHEDEQWRRNRKLEEEQKREQARQEKQRQVEEKRSRVAQLENEILEIRKERISLEERNRDL